MSIHVIMVMGVSGAGKTVVGNALAAALGWRFYDGDDLHSATNIVKMHRGQALSDEDRAPWLDAVAKLIAGIVDRKDHGVVACSALKHAYREQFRAAVPDRDALRFVYLDVPLNVLHERLIERPHHFAPVTLLDSQLATLEPPRDALRIDGTLSIPQIVHAVETAFAL